MRIENDLSSQLPDKPIYIDVQGFTEGAGPNRGVIRERAVRVTVKMPDRTPTTYWIGAQAAIELSNGLVQVLDEMQT